MLHVLVRGLLLETVLLFLLTDGGGPGLVDAGKFLFGKPALLVPLDQPQLLEPTPALATGVTCLSAMDLG